MFGFGEHHEQVYGANSDEHKSSLTHETIAGAAAFEAMKKYEASHPGDKHQLTKEVLAGLAGAEVDKLFETRGLDYLDRERAKHDAHKRAHELYDQEMN